MSESASQSLSSLPPDEALLVEKLCTHFENAWKRGERPRIEDYQPEVPEAVWPVLSRELLALEVAFRRHSTASHEPPGGTGAIPTTRSEPHSAGRLRPESAEETPVTAPGRPAPFVAGNRAAELPTIPGYSLLGELGRGGMGVVYRARQENGRVVALKLIRSLQGGGCVEVARFRIEAGAVACIDHPNVVRILDIGVHSGCPYFALEFVAGGSLAARIDGRPQPPRWAVETALALAVALEHVHGRGIFHRDIKPANVLLAEDGTPKLSDFGLAKFAAPMMDIHLDYATIHPTALDEEYVRRLAARKFPQLAALMDTGDMPPDPLTVEEVIVSQLLRNEAYSRPGLLGGDEQQTREITAFVDEVRRQSLGRLSPSGPGEEELTRPGSVMGSPPYMSPEQAAGRGNWVDHKTDIYSLGTVLYEMLAGHAPFSGRDFLEILHRVQNEPPPRIARALPVDLEMIVQRCLEKSPERRYASAAALADDLRQFLNGVPVDY